MSTTFKRISIALAAVAVAASSVMAQQQSQSTLTRRGASQKDRARKEAQAGPQVTDRMQAHYDASGKSVGDADRQWMRVIYRQLDLD